MKKYVALIMGLIAILPIAKATNFELSVNDAKGDASIADIDITRAWSSVESDNIVFHIQVAGKINDEYAYWITMWNGEEELGAVYTNGQAFYTGETSGGIAQYEVNGNTLLIYVPKGTVSGWQHFSFQAFAGKSYGMGEYDFTARVGDAGNGNEGNENESHDPAKEKPTDKSIDVKITNVVYEIKKVDDGTKWYVYIFVEGTTNGVDHVSLNFITYYKNGTSEWGSWLKGPFEYSGGFGGVEITEFRLNSTQGNWNKWEFKMKAKYPVTDPSYEWVKRRENIEKFSIYARAFKDAEETKWNQCHYDTVPKEITGGISFSGSGGGGESKEGKKKTTGFELGLALASMAAIAIGIKRGKK